MAAWAVMLAGAAAAGGCAGDTAARRYLCPRAAGPVVVDGRLEEPAWAAAPWSEPFDDIEGDARPDPAHETRMKMLWDGEALYVAARLEEPHVRASLERRDAVVWHDNDIELFLDPEGDGRLYYEIEVNALNTVFDLLLVRPYNLGGPALHGWDFAGLRTGVAIEGTLNDPSDTDVAWTVEMALPWTGFDRPARLVVPPEPGDVWRVNFSRVQWRHRVTGGAYEKVPDVPESNWSWSPQGAVNMHLPARWGFLEFAP